MLFLTDSPGPPRIHSVKIQVGHLLRPYHVKPHFWHYPIGVVCKRKESTPSLMYLLKMANPKPPVPDGFTQSAKLSQQETAVGSLLLVATIGLLATDQPYFVPAILLGAFAINILKIASVRNHPPEIQRILISEGRGYIFTPLIRWLYRRIHRL